MTRIAVVAGVVAALGLLAAAFALVVLGRVEVAVDLSPEHRELLDGDGGFA